MSSMKPFKMSDANTLVLNSSNKHEYSCTPSHNNYSKTQFVGNFTASGSPPDMKSHNIYSNNYANQHNLPL